MALKNSTAVGSYEHVAFWNCHHFFRYGCVWLQRIFLGHREKKTLTKNCDPAFLGDGDLESWKNIHHFSYLLYNFEAIILGGLRGFVNQPPAVEVFCKNHSTTRLLVCQGSLPILKGLFVEHNSFGTWNWIRSRFFLNPWKTIRPNSKLPPVARHIWFKLIYYSFQSLWILHNQRPFPLYM